MSSEAVNNCSRDSTEQGPAMTTTLAADLHAVRELYDRALRTKLPPRQFVGRGDAMDFLHAREHFDFADVEIVARSHAAEHGLPCAGRAMDFKAHADQLIDHMLDLIFGRASCMATIMRSLAEPQLRFGCGKQVLRFAQGESSYVGVRRKFFSH